VLHTVVLLVLFHRFRFGLWLPLVLKGSLCTSRADPNVRKIAEVLLITQTSMLLNKEQLITLWGAWNSDEISLKDKQLIINQLSGGTFSENPVEEKKSASPSWQRSRYLVSDG
jgi:hypothetical protein